MKEFNDVGILLMEDKEYYMRLEFPDMMKYVDKTNEQDLNKKIGGKEEWAKGIIKQSQNGDDYLEETSNQSKLNNIIKNNTKTNTSNYIDNNIRDINSSSSQAPSDKGSDDKIPFDTQAYGQQVQDDCERNEREYQKLMKDIEKNKKTK